MLIHYVEDVEYYFAFPGFNYAKNFFVLLTLQKNFYVYDITLRVLLNLIIYLSVDNYAIVTVIRFKFKTKFGFLIDCYLTWKFSCVKHLVKCILRINFFVFPYLVNFI